MSRGEVLGSLRKFLIEPRPSPLPLLRSPPPRSVKRRDGSGRDLSTPDNLNAFDNLISGYITPGPNRDIVYNKPRFQPGSLMIFHHIITRASFFESVLGFKLKLVLLSKFKSFESEDFFFKTEESFKIERLVVS